MFYISIAFTFTSIIRSPNLSTSVTLSATLSSAITASPRCHIGPPAYITLYPSLTKSPPSFHLTSLTPIILNLFLRISSLTFSNFPITFIVRTFHVPTLISFFYSILRLPSPYTFRFPFQPSAVPFGAYSAFERSDGFSSTASSALPEKDRIARRRTALCSSPGAVFGRVLFGQRVSQSSTIGFLDHFSAMCLG